jgi:hypothetical protein
MQNKHCQFMLLSVVELTMRPKEKIVVCTSNLMQFLRAESGVKQSCGEKNRQDSNFKCEIMGKPTRPGKQKSDLKISENYNLGISRHLAKVNQEDSWNHLANLHCQYLAASISVTGFESNLSALMLQQK